MRRALAEVEKKEVPPGAAPMDIGAPKGVAVNDQQYNDDDNCWARSRWAGGSGEAACKDYAWRGLPQRWSARTPSPPKPIPPPTTMPLPDPAT